MDKEQAVEKLNDLLDRIGWGRFHYYLFAVCGSAWATDMLWIVNIGIILDDAKEEWNMHSSEKGLMASMFLLGTLVGCYTWGYLGDRFGRMFSFKKTILIASLGSFLLATSIHPGMFILFETIVGFAVGGELALGGTVFSEFLPPKKAWTLTLLATSWCFGGALGGFLAMVIAWSGAGWLGVWRWLSIASGLIQFGFFLGRRNMPETPRYLLYAEHTHHAENCLRLIIATNQVESIEEVCLEPSRPEGTQACTKDDEPLVTHEKDSLLKTLFSGKYWRATILLTLVYFLGIGACIALIEFMPELLEQSGDASLGSEFYKYQTIMIQQVSAIPSIFIAACLVETCFGRRWTIAIPFFASGIFAYIFLYAQSRETV